jgi:hypothetical protein
MRLDPNTHVYVAATTFRASVAFAVAAMAVLGLAIHMLIFLAQASDLTRAARSTSATSASAAWAPAFRFAVEK